MSERLPDYAVANRELWTKSNAEYTDGSAERSWAETEITWGMCHALESDVRTLPDLRGKDVVELGCGTAYFGAGLKRAGAARVVGVDVTPAQLATAERMNEKFGLGLEFVEANAEETGLPDASFDLAVSEYGASIWCDPYKWVAEAARLLRLGGELVFLRNSTLAMLCATEDEQTSEQLQRPQRGLHRIDWADDGSSEFHLGHGDWVRLLRENGFEIVDLVELFATERTPEHTYYSFSREWAEQWPWEEISARAQARMSVPPAPPLLLASTSPQRRAILQQLGIPFDVVAPRYDENDLPEADAVELVREHARGKAHSVMEEAAGRPVLGVDTAVVLDGRIYGKPADAGAAERMLEALSGQTHVVVSGLCVVTPGWEELHHAETRVRFRALTPRDLAAYVATGEWEGRAGGYAIQGVGAGLVEALDGDYLNVVGLPAALLVDLLATRFAGTYGFG